MHRSGDVLCVDANVPVFREGDCADCAYIIEEGMVEVSLIRDGKKVVVGKRTVGEVFGEMAIIDDQPRTATVSTLTPCKLLTIDRSLVRNRLSQSDPIVRMYLDVILARFRQTMGELRELTLREFPPETTKLSPSAGTSGASNNYEYAINEIRLEDEIKCALLHDEFELYFQPIVDLWQKHLVGFEALIRWRHRQRGLIFPNDFLATAEASGLIVPIGSWVFRRSCEFLRVLKNSFPENQPNPLFVAVNISAREIVSSLFAETASEVVEKAGISASNIKLEITETALMSDHFVVKNVLQRLKNAGFSIAIDDFGTGYSSLSYLHQFPFDTLKIDKTFVQSLNKEGKNNAIVASIASLAKHLNLAVVAEGIETSLQEKRIRDLKCQFGQGYLYARPMTELHALELMRRWEGQKEQAVTALA
jgi:diguanylate cyclase